MNRAKLYVGFDASLVWQSFVTFCKSTEHPAPQRTRTPREPLARLVAVSSVRRAPPPCPARVRSTQTDSQCIVAGREWQKGAFRGTYARSADVSRQSKHRAAVSSGYGEQAQLNPSAVRGRTDSHAGLISRGGSSQGGRVIQLNPRSGRSNF